MQDDGLWNLLNKPLLVGVITAIVTGVIQSKILWAKWYKGFFDKVPDYVREAGISPLIYRLFYKKTPLEKIEPITKKNRIVSIGCSILIVLTVGAFMYYPFKIIIDTPPGFTNLKYMVSGEKFLLSENEAISYPNKSDWRIDQDVCHSETLQNLSVRYKISYELIYSICNNVGLEKGKANIKERVDSYNKSRAMIFMLFFIFTLYVFWSIMLLIVPLQITPKLIQYWNSYLERKYMIY